MNVVATISWDKYPSFDYCFDGVEKGSAVAVATYACKSERAGFLRGYDAMLERIRPEAVICYGEPFPGMRGNVCAVPVCHPRKFHRELKACALRAKKRCASGEMTFDGRASRWCGVKQGRRRAVDS